MSNPERYWDSDVVAERLRQLQRGESSILGLGKAGLVRARCLRTERLWELRPYQGDAWRWVMVGPARVPGRWSVVFGDGEHEPERIRESEMTAAFALWEACDFLRWDLTSQ